MRATYDPLFTLKPVAVETMIDQAPGRVILAHGRWFETDGTARLRQSFSWLLS